MFKKTLYPFTDWKWLLLPLASIGLGGFFMMMWVGMFALMAYHDGHTTGQFAVFGIGYLASLGAFFILMFSCLGYLLRVARKSTEEEPLKLPNWSGVAGMVKEGLLAWIGCCLMFYLVALVSFLPLILTLLGAGFLNHDPAEGLGWLGSLALVAVIAFSILGYLLIFFWFIFFQPLLLARYAKTRKFRHLLSPRWAWRAFTIAPTEYLIRISVWTIYLVIITILTPLTMGVAYVIGYLLAPFSMINCAYLVGDYYAIYLDD